MGINRCDDTVVSVDNAGDGIFNKLDEIAKVWPVVMVEYTPLLLRYPLKQCIARRKIEINIKMYRSFIKRSISMLCLYLQPPFYLLLSLRIPRPTSLAVPWSTQGYRYPLHYINQVDLQGSRPGCLPHM